MVVRHMSSICWTATVADYFPAYGRSRSIHSSSNLTKRRTGADPSRYIFSLTKGEREARATAGCWRNPSARQQQMANGRMRLVEGAPNLGIVLAAMPRPMPDD